MHAALAGTMVLLIFARETWVSSRSDRHDDGVMPAALWGSLRRVVPQWSVDVQSNPCGFKAISPDGRGHHPFRPLAEIPSGLSRKDSIRRIAPPPIHD